MSLHEGRPDVTVIVVSYNCATFIHQTLSSVRASEGVRIQLVIVDNHSADNTREVIRDLSPEAEIVSLGQNAGFAEANNIGARAARGRYLLLLNPDAWVEPDSIARMTALLDSHDDIGVLGSKVLHPSGAIQDVGNQLDRMGFPVPLRPAVATGLVRNAFFASGCGFMTRRENWEQIGGLDGRFFMFCEEVDYCWRVQLLGQKIVIAADITIWHTGGATLEGGYANASGGHTTSPRRVYLRERNTLAMFIANASPFGLIGMLAAWITNVPEALGFLALGRVDLARQYPRALAWNLRNLRGTLRRRHQVQKTRTSPHRKVSGWARGSGKLRLLRQAGIPTIPDQT